MVDFSVLMSVYRNDKPEHFRRAIESITIEQTVKPTEVVIVVDGPVPPILESEIKTIVNECSIIKIIWLKENGGLGNALRVGLDAVSNEIVARMDSDDVSLPYRFYKQVSFMEENPNIAALGGQIAEFIGNEDNIVGYRKVPYTPEECRKYYIDRDPLNHMTVILRKSAVINVGNYLPWHLDEDTYLWGRLLKGGYEIANLPDVLVNVRVGKEMYARRGGWKYFKSDIKILKWKLDNGLSSNKRYLYNVGIRFFVQVIMPNKIRGWIFKKFLRNQN